MTDTRTENARAVLMAAVDRLRARSLHNADNVSHPPPPWLWEALRDGKTAIANEWERQSVRRPMPLGDVSAKLVAYARLIAAVERWHTALAKGHDPDAMSEQMEAAFDVLEVLSPPTTKETT